MKTTTMVVGATVLVGGGLAAWYYLRQRREAAAAAQRRADDASRGAITGGLVLTSETTGRLVLPSEWALPVFTKQVDVQAAEAAQVAAAVETNRRQAEEFARAMARTRMADYGDAKLTEEGDVVIVPSEDTRPVLRIAPGEYPEMLIEGRVDKTPWGLILAAAGVAAVALL